MNDSNEKLRSLNNESMRWKLENVNKNSSKINRKQRYSNKLRISTPNSSQRPTQPNSFQLKLMTWNDRSVRQTTLLLLKKTDSWRNRKSLNNWHSISQVDTHLRVLIWVNWKRLLMIWVIKSQGKRSSKLRWRKGVWKWSNWKERFRLGNMLLTLRLNSWWEMSRKFES